MKGNVGGKPHGRDELVEKIRAVPVQQRQNQRQLAEASGVSKRLVGILLRDGLLHRVTDRIKPSLTVAIRIARLQFVLSHLNESTMKFDEGYDVVHVDEKWFNEDKDDRAYLLLLFVSIIRRFLRHRRGHLSSSVSPSGCFKSNLGYDISNAGTDIKEHVCLADISNIPNK
ncbi:hypothetical protein PC116_g9974 [Phytophthora cactorum]|uniref:Uncharacterized protein n=1 Tax=Phytophthora cactorum TaxID=29920 RepID=A0A8T1DKM2_9STRA|nr:hypothetical protein Pcac1_g1930 [Phytophthora cactorum]KAG2833498.1 hypothetical protein PC111_g6192 [Phytophthora cactorum]KAG2867893.1 hypothetical protein PC113_g1535 [Phytophthora cactorum]KAG2932823.1 hypothetical protein PC114_g1675 [Phytophthora cactorum]KAG2941266.1 hypothetical protein PC115_g2045 [Phytophthora cactorum]